VGSSGHGPKGHSIAAFRGNAFRSESCRPSLGPSVCSCFGRRSAFGYTNASVTDTNTRDAGVTNTDTFGLIIRGL
jgi:hypothetical protein